MLKAPAKTRPYMPRAWLALCRCPHAACLSRFGLLTLTLRLNCAVYIQEPDRGDGGDREPARQLTVPTHAVEAWRESRQVKRIARNARLANFVNDILGLNLRIEVNSFSKIHDN